MNMRPRPTIGPLLGLASVVLLVVGNELTKVGGSSPPLHGSAEEYGRAIGSSPVVLVGAYLAILAWLAMGGFFLAVAEEVRARRGNARAARQLGASAVLIAAVGISGAPPLLAASVMSGDGDLSPEVAKGLLLLNAVVFPLGWLLVAIAMALAAVQLRRLAMMGPWLCRAGMVLSAALAAGSLGVWWAEAFMMVWLLALIWIGISSVVLTRRAVRATSDDPRQVPVTTVDSSARP